jgi:hypothetical protein
MHRGSEVQFVARWHSPRVLQITEGKNHPLPRCIYYFLHNPTILVEKIIISNYSCLQKKRNCQNKIDTFLQFFHSVNSYYER